MKSQKWQNDFYLFPTQTIVYDSNPSLCPNFWCQRSWRWMVLWWLTRPSRTNTKKDILSIIGDRSAKVRSQEIPGVTGKFGLGVRNEAGQRLTKFCQENALVIANTLFFFFFPKHPLLTTQEKTLHMDITRWSPPKADWLYSLQLKMEMLYTVIKNKTGSWLWVRSWTPYCKIQT